MYRFPSNGLDFKKGYRLGIEKGRSLERRMALMLVIGFVLAFEIINALVLKSVC